MVDFNRLALAPCVETFGYPVVYVSGSGDRVALDRAGLPLVGIFNRYATEEKIDTNSGLVRQSVAPTLALNVEDLPEGMPLPCKAEIMEVDGNSWEIADPVSDNFGQLLLKLKRLK